MQRFELFQPIDETRQMPSREIHTTVAYNDENPDPAHQIHALGDKAYASGLQVGRAYSHSVLQAHAKKHRLKIVNRSNEEVEQVDESGSAKAALRNDIRHHEREAERTLAFRERYNKANNADVGPDGKVAPNFDGYSDDMHGYHAGMVNKLKKKLAALGEEVELVSEAGGSDAAARAKYHMHAMSWHDTLGFDPADRSTHLAPHTRVAGCHELAAMYYRAAARTGNAMHLRRAQLNADAAERLTVQHGLKRPPAVKDMGAPSVKEEQEMSVNDEARNNARDNMRAPWPPHRPVSTPNPNWIDPHGRRPTDPHDRVGLAKVPELPRKGSAPATHQQMLDHLAHQIEHLRRVHMDHTAKPAVKRHIGKAIDWGDVGDVHEHVQKIQKVLEDHYHITK